MKIYNSFSRIFYLRCGWGVGSGLADSLWMKSIFNKSFKAILSSFCLEGSVSGLSSPRIPKMSLSIGLEFDGLFSNYRSEKVEILDIVGAGLRRDPFKYLSLLLFCTGGVKSWNIFSGLKSPTFRTDPLDFGPCGIIGGGIFVLSLLFSYTEWIFIFIPEKMYFLTLFLLY